MDYRRIVSLLLRTGVLCVAVVSPVAGVTAAPHTSVNKTPESAGIHISQSESLRNWIHSARKGDREAQYNLGLIYEQGLGVRRDLGKALFWYKKAAQQKHATAAYNYASMLHHGKGTSPDLRQAAYWYERAANQGNVVAQASLGYLYSLRSTPLADAKKAFYWLERAAKLGYPEAQFNLALLYSTGRGTTLDYVSAYAWFAVSAANDYANAAKSRDFIATRLDRARLQQATALAKHLMTLYFKKFRPEK